MNAVLLIQPFRFVNLIQHRFASHCCEKLFVLSAPVVAQEFLRPPKPDATDPDQPFVLMENCFLSTVAELQGNVGFLMNDRFATHTLRVLLLVLAGEPADSPLMKTILQSKRKENVKVSGSSATSDSATAKLSVPNTFTDALSSLIQASVAGLDTTNLRALAKHEQANPMLQLLLRIELTHFGKSRGKEQDSIIRRLLPDDIITAESESAIFLNDLIYDSIGSHLVETIVEFAPAKIFKNLFQQFYKERIASLARNEIASYVACKVLERLSRDDLLAVHESLIPVLPRLLELNRVNVIRTLIERCAVRKVDTQAIAVELQIIYADASNPKRFDILRFLRFDNAPEVPDPHPQIPADAPQSTTQPPLRPAPVSSSQLQSNLLAQAMIASPGPLSALILDSLPHLPTPSLLQLAKSPAPSRTLQAALTAPRPSIASHRTLIQAFNGHVASLAVHAVGSHVVDALWHATQGQPPFIRARFAEELVQAEMQLRESVPGRAVWRNWQMDLYKRRRADWIALGKRTAEDVESGLQVGEGLDGDKIADEGTVPVRVKKGAVAARGENVNGYRGEIVGGGGGRSGGGRAGQGPDQGRRKTPLELARERHAQKKAAGAGTGRPNKGAADGVAVET